jgi:hypothetical protein
VTKESAKGNILFLQKKKINTRLRLKSYFNLETKGATTSVLVPRIIG